LGKARGETNGAEFNAMISTGYDWKKGNWTFGPTATFEYSNIGINKFTEEGSLAALEIQDQNEDSLRSTLGLRASYDWKTCGVIVRPEVRAAWQHEYGDRSYPIDSRFASGAGDIFTVHGPQIGRDNALISAGFAVRWNSRISTYVYYQGQIGRSNYDSHGATGGVRVSF
jgi:outer membrane autotransporter protein